MNPMFYFLFALTVVLAATANASTPVVDTDGDTLVEGRSYYVLPGYDRTLDAAGGLRLEGNFYYSGCPFYIRQEHINKGIPVRFSNWRSRVGFVPELENLNIEMDIKDRPNSTYWWVDSSDEDSWPQYIKSCIGAAAGGTPPPGDDPRSFFQIRKILKQSSTGYKFSYCPNDDDCIDAGWFMRDIEPNLRLALTHMPYWILFEKVPGKETSSKTMSILSERN